MLAGIDKSLTAAPLHLFGAARGEDRTRTRDLGSGDRGRKASVYIWSLAMDRQALTFTMRYRPRFLLSGDGPWGGGGGGGGGMTQKTGWEGARLPWEEGEERGGGAGE